MSLDNDDKKIPGRFVLNSEDFDAFLVSQLTDPDFAREYVRQTNEEIASLEAENERLKAEIEYLKLRNY